MLYKKRWSDGLHNDFDHLDEFEAKFYCFGGDGGGSSGGGSFIPKKDSPSSSNDEQQKQRALSTLVGPAAREATVDAVQAAAQQSLDAQPTGFRGEQSAAAPTPAPAPEISMATAASPSMAAVSAQPAAGFGLATIAPDALMPDMAPTIAPAPSAAQPVSFGSMPAMGPAPAPTMAPAPAPSVAQTMPIEPSQAYNQATSDRTISGLASMLGVDLPSSVNIAGYDVGFGSTPGTSGLSGPTVDLGPGTLGFGTDKDLARFGLGYNMKFADGGIVTLRRR